MDRTRRNMLLGAGATSAIAMAIATGLMKPTSAHALELNTGDSSGNDFDAAMKEVGSLKTQDSSEIEITLPDIAEQGALVPIEVFSHIPNSEAIAILVENNAIPVVATFEFRNGALPRIATRIKLAESSPVHVVVRAGGQYFHASRPVKAVIGGCGDESFASEIKSKDNN